MDKMKSYALELRIETRKKLSNPEFASALRLAAERLAGEGDPMLDGSQCHVYAPTGDLLGYLELTVYGD